MLHAANKSRVWAVRISGENTHNNVMHRGEEKKV